MDANALPNYVLKLIPLNARLGHKFIESNVKVWNKNQQRIVRSTFRKKYSNRSVETTLNTLVQKQEQQHTIMRWCLLSRIDCATWCECARFFFLSLHFINLVFCSCYLLARFQFNRMYMVFRERCPSILYGWKKGRWREAKQKKNISWNVKPVFFSSSIEIGSK